LIALLLGFCLHAVPAQAQLVRTFVSAESGNDADDCSRLSPCRSLAGTLAKTQAAGEITVLDAGTYGSVTIGKAISIVNDGVGTAAIAARSGETGITITAGANDEITLRGLVIEGLAGSQNGIQFNSGKSLVVDTCVIRNLAGLGISYTPTVSSRLTVSNTMVADNSLTGILIQPNGANLSVRAALHRLEAHNNANGVIVFGGNSVGGTINVTVADSVAAGNSNGVGLGVNAQADQPAAQLMVTRSVSANNLTGIAANGPFATMRIGGSTVTGNTFGSSVQSSGTLRSYGNNQIDGNAGDEGAPLAIPLK